MFSKAATQPLTLQIDGHRLTFNTLADFEFALASRTEVPTAKITRLVRLSDEALQEEARAIGKAEKYFVDLVAAGMQDDSALGHAFQGLDIKLFSQDHQWRSIMSSLSEQAPGYEDYKRIALVKYMQYLAARQEVVKSISAERQHRAVTPLFRDEPEPRGADELSKITLALNLAEIAGEAALNEGYVRLPKGEAVSVRLPAGQDLPLSLAGHRFRLAAGNPCRLVGEHGDKHTLQQGKNLIGRELGNHIVVDGNYRDVSRKHLLIDLADLPIVRLTDVSSHGTFIPADSLKSS